MLFSNILSAIIGTTCSFRSLSFCSNSAPWLLDATLDDLRAGLDSGQWTSVDLVVAYLARIHEVNAELHAVIETNPDALAIAAALDHARSDSHFDASIQPLHGVPVLVQDNIATADRRNTSASFFASLGATVPDSTVVIKLRKAGAIILGKSRLSKWSAARGGQVEGAYYPRMDPGGSSSGSAVAASLGLVWAALGTDAMGSLVNSAHKNNVVGIRPTIGLTSRYLALPLSMKHETIGPMARTVKDAAYLLQAIAGADAKDIMTSASPFGHNTPDYAAACRTSGLKGKRIGVPKGMQQWWLDKTIVHAHIAIQEALDVLRDAGAEIIEDVELPGVRILMHEHNKLDGIYDTAEEDYLHSSAGVQDDALATSTQRSRAFHRQRYLAGRLGLTGALRNNSLDALVMPTVYASKLGSAIGCPVISVPLGKTPDWTPSVKNHAGKLDVTAPNQPFGLAFAGEQWTEEALIGMAYVFEQRTMVRWEVKPHVQPKTDLKDIVSQPQWEEI